MVEWGAGIPLNKTREVEDDRDKEIQSRMFWPKPKACNTSSRYDQSTELKALDISSFKKRLGFFFVCKALIRF